MDNDTIGSNTPPEYWGVCDSTSTPECYTVLYKIDTIVSPDSSTFCTLRARGWDNNAPSTTEHLFTELITPLDSGFCYQFSAWLLHTFNGSNSGTTEPVKLQLWGGLDSCSMDEMLYESELIVTGGSWLEYNFLFSVQYNNYPYFYLRPYWDFENVSDSTYKGVIMMDNLDIQRIKPIETIMEDTIYFSLDPPKILGSREGISYSWSPPDVVSDPDQRDPLLLDYSDFVLVTVLDEDRCPLYDRYIVMLDCDTLYPNEMTIQHEMYYSILRDNILNAAEGYSYRWEPQINLTDYFIRNPVITDYQESFHVAVEDKYGCFHNEQFNILAHCDTLYPQKSFYTLDTVIHIGEELLLHPSFGEPSAAWSPSLGLSCAKCLYPEANPTGSTLYRIRLTDQFNCAHEELFAIEVILEIPNVITPNGDGYNDEFIIGGLPPGSSMHIFGKEGVILYQNSNYGYPEWWRGTDNKGKMISSGNYWFALEIPSLNSVKKDFIFLKR